MGKIPAIWHKEKDLELKRDMCDVKTISSQFTAYFYLVVDVEFFFSNFIEKKMKELKKRLLAMELQCLYEKKEREKNAGDIKKTKTKNKIKCKTKRMNETRIT